MDKNFDTWFSRFMWGTDVVFLAASTPHIAAWYAHFDGNPTDWLSSLYAWLVGFGLAIAIDGVSLMLLFALTRMISRGVKGWGVYGGILFFMGFIAALSWFINWQYDLTFASTAFSKADATTVNLWVHTVSVGSLNPIIGGAFSVLIMAYALISKVVKEDDKPAMTDAEYEQEKRRIEREQELKQLRKGNNQGILALGKETLLGQGQDANDLLNRALSYLRDARELLPVDQEERACKALAVHLNIRVKTVLPLLIQSRSIIEREDQEGLIEGPVLEQEEDQEGLLSAPASGPLGVQEDDQEALLNNLQGRDTVPVETAARVLNCQVKYVVRLRNAGKLKHASKREDLITVASLRSYLAGRSRRGGATEVQTEKLKVVPSVEDREPVSA